MKSMLKRLSERQIEINTESEQLKDKAAATEAIEEASKALEKLEVDVNIAGEASKMQKISV